MPKIRPIGSGKLDTDNIVSDPINFSGNSPYALKIGTIKDAKLALANAHFSGSPEAIKREVYRRFPELNNKEILMAKKKTKAQKKVEVVMGEFKDKKLKSSSGEKVKSRAQAVAVALSVAGLSKKKKKSKRKVKKRKK